jgi:hypothetical protein
LVSRRQAIVRPDPQKAQFNSMPKIFSSSETQDLKVLDNPAVVRCIMNEAPESLR